MKALLALILSAAALFWSVLAQAADPFTVAKVPVDARADSAIEAQTVAVQQGYVSAARILLDRLTLESERYAQPLPELTPLTVGPLIRGQSIDNERRSNTRYLGDLTVAFNPSAVQQFLRQAELTMVTSQAQERLVLVDGRLPQSFRDALLSRRFGHALTPLRSLPEDDLDTLPVPLQGRDITDIAAANGVERVLLLSTSPGSVYARDLRIDGTDMEIQDLGAVRSLDALVARMERDWKTATAVPSDTASSTTVTVLYSSLPEWQRLQRAINTSAQVRDARLDAISKDGALMTITYGDFDRLAAEMRQKGARLENDPAYGLVIRR